MPANASEWAKVAQDFEDKWHFPHCLGSIDGKHVRIVPPPGSGSFYYNYKKFHSIVLMACGNANYEFIWCEVGCNGRVSDGGVIKKTKFYQQLIDGSLNLPQQSPVNGIDLPYVFIGDEAFALREDLLKPFSQAALNLERRIFNYRLSRARRIIENIFAIICNRFGILHCAINLPVETIDLIIMTICVLHNFLRKKTPHRYMTPEEELSNEFQHNMVSLENRQLSRNSAQHAKAVRDKFLDYFNTVGAVDWQVERCGR